MDQRERRELYVDEGMMRLCKVYAMSGSRREDAIERRPPNSTSSSE